MPLSLAMLEAEPEKECGEKEVTNKDEANIFPFKSRVYVYVSLFIHLDTIPTHFFTTVSKAQRI